MSAQALAQIQIEDAATYRLCLAACAVCVVATPGGELIVDGIDGI